MFFDMSVNVDNFDELYDKNLDINLSVGSFPIFPPKQTLLASVDKKKGNDVLLAETEGKAEQRGFSPMKIPRTNTPTAPIQKKERNPEMTSSEKRKQKQITSWPQGRRVTCLRGLALAKKSKDLICFLDFKMVNGKDVENVRNFPKVK